MFGPFHRKINLGMVGQIGILLDSFGEDTKSPSGYQAVGRFPRYGVMCATLFKSAVCMYVYVVSSEDGDLMWAKTVENGK